MKTFYQGLFVCLLASIVIAIDGCSSDDDTGSVAASYKLETTPALFSVSVLNSIKSAISRNNNQDAFHEINNYLIDNQFTNSNGDLVLPRDITTTLCSSSNFSSAGKLTRSGDILSGSLVFENFCHQVPDTNGIFNNLIINGTADYLTDESTNKLNLSYDIFASFVLERHIYFGDVNIDLSSQDNAVLVNRYIGENNIEYNTDGLGVSGDIDQGYNINGNIVIGEQGSIGITTIIPISYGESCGITPEIGKITVSTNEIDLSLEAQKRFCQIEICSTATDTNIESCITI